MDIAQRIERINELYAQRQRIDAESPPAMEAGA